MAACVGERLVAGVGLCKHIFAIQKYIDNRIPRKAPCQKTKPIPLLEEFVAQANITAAQYDEMYQQSVEDPEGFWSEQAENYLSWFKPWNSVCDWSFDEQDLHIRVV